MLQKVFHIVVVACLSVLLLFGAAAKEAVHLFAQHEDTIHHNDHICPKGEAHFDHQHHHCAFLNYVLEPFANDTFFPKILLYKVISFTIKNSSLQELFSDSTPLIISLRGPPTKLA